MDTFSMAKNNQSFNAKVLMVDALIGNDYSICLCEALESNGVSVNFVTTEDRSFNKKPKFIVKRWAPSKSQNVKRLGKLFKYYSYLFKITLYGIRNRDTIIHYQFLRRRSEALIFILLKLFRIRVVHTAHNVLPHESNRLDIFLNNLVYKLSSAIIVHSDFIKDKILKNFNVDKKKIHVIPHGNFDFFLDFKSSENRNAREILKLTVDEKVLLFFGFIREYKGLDLLLEAFEIAAGNDDKIKLVIAGSPASENLKKKYMQIIENSNSKGKIDSYLKFIPIEEVSVFFNASDLVVLPYKSIDHSGIIHLAYSFGKPVLATRVGDFAEVIEQGKSGFILDSNDAINLAKWINSSFSDMDILNRMSDYSLNLSKTKYSWDSIALKTKRLYSEIITPKKNKS